MTRGVLNILYVEDDPDDVVLLRQYLTEVLGANNFELDIDADGADTADWVRQSRYDLILLDYDLGQRTGLEVLEDIIASAHPPPVVFITGRGNEEVAVTAIKRGAVDYLTKDNLTPDSLAKAALRAVALTKLQTFNDQVQADLAEAVTLRASLLDIMDEAVLVLDVAGRIVLANRAATTLLGPGEPGTDLTGKFFHLRHHLTKSNGALCDETSCPIMTAVRNGRSVPRTDDTWTRADLSPLPVRYVVKPLRLARQESWRSLVIFANRAPGQDRTVQREILRSTSRALEETRDQAQQQTDLLNLLAHALNTPLTPLVLQLSALRRRAGSNADALQLQAFDVMERNVRRLQGIFQDVLTAVHIRSGTLQTRPRTVDLTAIVNAAAAADHDIAHWVGGSVDLLVPEGLVVQADPEHTQRIVRSMFETARSAATPRGRIAVEATTGGDHVTLVVTGYGKGLSEADLIRMFKPLSSEPGPVADILHMYLASGFAVANGGTVEAEPIGRPAAPDAPGLPERRRLAGVKLRLRLPRPASQPGLNAQSDKAQQDRAPEPRGAEPTRKPKRDATPLDAVDAEPSGEEASAPDPPGNPRSPQNG